MDEHRYEHSRTRLGALPSRTWDAMGPRMLRPLIGGAVGASIVLLFLAIRGGTAAELNELTGTAWGGWSRHADVHLLIVVNLAVGVAIAVNFAAEWVHNWLSIGLLVVTAAVLIALRPARRDRGSRRQHHARADRPVPLRRGRHRSMGRALNRPPQRVLIPLRRKRQSPVPEHPVNPDARFLHMRLGVCGCVGSGCGDQA